MSGWWRVAAIAVFGLVAGWPAPAYAESTIGITVGYAGTVHAGRSVPVVVEVAVDRLARGTVEVTARAQNGGPDRTVVQVPIEVPGGATSPLLTPQRLRLSGGSEPASRA